MAEPGLRACLAGGAQAFHRRRQGAPDAIEGGVAGQRPPDLEFDRNQLYSCWWRPRTAQREFDIASRAPSYSDSGSRSRLHRLCGREGSVSQAGASGLGPRVGGRTSRTT